MRISDWSSDVCSADLLDQAFVPRELILRANDRLTVVRLPVRTQKIVALGAVALLAWTLLATGALVVQDRVIAGKNRAIENQKLAYFELLSDVSEYHDQFAQLTANLAKHQEIRRASCRERGCQYV